MTLTFIKHNNLYLVIKIRYFAELVWQYWKITNMLAMIVYFAPMSLVFILSPVLLNWGSKLNFAGTKKYKKMLNDSNERQILKLL